MNEINLRPILTVEDKNTFVSEIQEAFQNSYVSEFGQFEKTILPTEEIEKSFNTKGAEAYIAEINGERVGGTIIVINDKTGYNSLDLLYVKAGMQNTGNGFKIWKAIEELHPETRVWETHTPYYDKRNIHFYVNRCGFKIVEFSNSRPLEPHFMRQLVPANTQRKKHGYKPIFAGLFSVLLVQKGAFHYGFITRF